MSVKLSTFCKWFLIVLASILSTATDASIQNCRKNFKTCHCNESYKGYNLTQKDPPLCYRLFSKVSNWNNASNTCKQEYSYLLNFLSQDSSPYKEVLNLGIDTLWIGIKRKSGFYVEQSFEPHLFKESKKYGKKWKPNEPLLDCVALDVNSGLLITLDCSSTLPFICQNHQFPSNPIPSVVCPEKYLFSFQLMPNAESCVRYEDPTSFLNAEKNCLNENGSLASLKTYETLNYQNNLSSFWLKNGSAVCNSNNGTCDENGSHSFVCIIRPKNITVVPKIQPTILTSFLSTDLDKSPLICDVLVDNKNISYNSNVYYQWYKNEIPIPMSTENKLFEVRFYPDPWKTSTSPLIRQGIYHCEVQVLGSPYSSRSEYVNYFYSDTSTYIMIISGVKKKLHKDYSLLDFWKLKMRLNVTMSPVTTDLQKVFPDVTWEFQNISLQDNFTKVTLLLFVNQSFSLHSESMDKIEMYETFKKDVLKRNLFMDWGDVSIILKSADYCFEELVSSTETGFDGILKWKSTDQTKNAISEPLCIDKWKLQTRLCKPNFIEGAEWSHFNYSMCSSYQQSVGDLGIKCPDNFKNTKTGICFRVHKEEETYNDALEICSNNSTYLSGFEIFKEIEATENLESSNYWLSPKLFLYKIQSFGMKPITDYRLSYNKSLEFEKGYFDNEVCAVASKSKTQFKKDINFCDKKLPFICIQHPQRVLESILFSKAWIKMSQSETCYHFEDNKLTWAEANQTCNSFPLKSSLLEDIQNLTNYLHFKNMLKKLTLLEVGSPWWMNLIQENDNLNWVSSVERHVNYFDWNPYTNFNLLKSAGLLSLDASSKKIQWMLKEPSSQESFICEMKSCNVSKGPTYVYIEDRTVLDEVTTVDYLKIVSKFDIRCVPTGWYLLNSIYWYKDGYHLSFIQNSSRLMLSEVQLISNLTITLSVQGYYWCSVDQEKPLKRIYSPKILYRVPGVHAFVLYVQTENRNTFEDCVSHVLDIEMSSDFLNFLKEILPDNFLHSYYRSISCEGKTLHIHLYFQKSLENEEDILEQVQGNVKMNEISIMNLLKNDFSNVLKLTVRSTISCLEEKTASNGKYLTWPSTPLGKYAVSKEMCITGKRTILRRQCLGDFNVGAFWSQILDECVKVESETTIKLHNLSVSQVTERNIFNISFNLKILTSNADEISTADAQYVSQILMNMAEISSISPEVLDNVVSAIDTLLDTMQLKQIENNHPSLNTSCTISSALESIVSNVHTNNEILKLSRNNIALIVSSLNISAINFSTGGILKNWNMNVTTLYNGTDWQLNKMFDTLEAGVVLPDSLVFEKVNETNNNLNLGVVVQRSAHFEKNIHVVSPQIDVSLGNEHIYDVDPPIEMIFKVSQIGDSSLYKCAYWDQQLNDNFGGWSFKGCFSRLINDHQMQCLCNHLTSFAVILELKPGDEILKVHQITLSIITYVGCSLSILGLGIIILTFITFRKWRKDIKHKILFHLSLALISFLVIFLAAIERKESEYVCIVAAVCLHYFMLASFAWMLVEAVMQYLSFVKVVGTYIPCLMQKAMAFGWGIPLIIVITILSTNYKYYYSRSNYCWLCDEVFYYAVAAPILTMLIINLLIFVIILYNNTCGRPNKRLRSNQNEKKEAVTTAKAMFCVSILLGLSWIFGFLAVDGAKLLFQYLFAATATLQGFLMSVFFVFRQKSTFDLWLNLVSPVTTPDTSHASHFTGTTDVTNRFIINHSRQSTPDRFSKATYKSSLSYITFN